jgi:hypothetical protein
VHRLGSAAREHALLLSGELARAPRLALAPQRPRRLRRLDAELCVARPRRRLASQLELACRRAALIPRRVSCVLELQQAEPLRTKPPSTVVGTRTGSQVESSKDSDESTLPFDDDVLMRHDDNTVVAERTGKGWRSATRRTPRSTTSSTFKNARCLHRGFGRLCIGIVVVLVLLVVLVVDRVALLPPFRVRRDARRKKIFFFIENSVQD